MGPQVECGRFVHNHNNRVALPLFWSQARNRLLWNPIFQPAFGTIQSLWSRCLVCRESTSVLTSQKLISGFHLLHWQNSRGKLGSLWSLREEMGAHWRRHHHSVSTKSCWHRQRGIRTFFLCYSNPRNIWLQMWQHSSRNKQTFQWFDSYCQETLWQQTYKCYYRLG